jgi:hypothetical protein
MADYIEGQDLVKQDAYDAVLKLDKMMGDLVAKFDLVAKSAISMNDTIVKSTSIPEVQQNQNTQKKNLDEIIKLEEKLKQAISDKGKVIELLRMELAKQNAANKELVKGLQAQEGSINQLRLQLNQATKAYDAMSKAERESGKGTTLLTNIQNTTTALKQLEANTGRFQRNVGNYTNSTFQLTQVMRELPNFAQSAEIGIRSLSNNLPMLADSFMNVRKEAGGTIPALKVFASSLFTFAGIFPLVLTGLIAYSKEIGELLMGTQALTEAEKEQIKVKNEAAKQVANEVANAKVQLAIINETSNSTTQRSKAYDNLNSTYPELLSNMTKEEALNGGIAASYEGLIIAIEKTIRKKSQYSLLEKEIAEQTRLQNEINRMTNPVQGEFVYFSEDQLRKIQGELSVVNDRIKQITKSISIQNELDSEYFGKRVTPTTKSTTTSTTTGTTKAPKAGKGGTDRPSRTLIQKPVAVDFLTDEQNLRELELLDARIQEMNDKTDLDMIARIKKRAEEIKRINEQYAKDELEVIKSNLEAQDADIAKIDEERMARLEAYVQIINSAIDIIGTVTSAISEKITSQTEKEIEAIDAREQAELDAIDRLTLSDSERDERKKIVELQAEARRKKAEEDKIRDLRKYALFQKGIDTAGIIANTALAVTKQLFVTPLPAGAPFVAAIVAAGAAQLAKVLATPLPQYELGTPEGGHTGGKAIVGEAGTELGRTPDGKLFLTPSKASIMDLPKRTEIIPHDITKDLLGATMVRLAQANTAVSLDMYQDELIEAFERGTDKITKAIYKNRTNISIGGSYRDYVKSNQL